MKLPFLNAKLSTRQTVFSFLTAMTLVTTGSVVHAANPDDEKIAIDMSGVTTTKNEIAVLQVLSEICPPMLNKTQQQGFANAYNIELKKLMPTLSNPKEAVQYLSTQQDYKQILADTRQWTLSYPKAENKAICNDLATYHY